MMGAVQADKFEPFKAKMEAAGLSEAAIAAFKMNYDQLVAGVTGLVSSASMFAVYGTRTESFRSCPTATSWQA